MPDQQDNDKELRDGIPLLSSDMINGYQTDNNHWNSSSGDSVIFWGKGNHQPSMDEVHCLGLHKSALYIFDFLKVTHH